MLLEMDGMFILSDIGDLWVGGRIPLYKMSASPSSPLPRHLPAFTPT